MTLTYDFPNWNPIEYASQGNAILGIRDSGKTVTAVGRAEKLLDADIPIAVIDPIGRWRYLRVAGAGENGKGYPVVVAGGMDGDLPLSKDNAEALIRAAMQNRVSIVFDLYTMDLSKADWRRICEAVIRTMLYENKQYGLRHLFIEEAAEFAPQRVQPGQGQVYAEVEKLARMGGNALVGYTLINQRSEEVNKAVLELCDTLILHRQKGRNSLTALDKWLKIAGTKSETKAIIDTMPTLGQGEAWVWQSGSDKPVRVQFPLVHSFVPDRRSTTGAATIAHAKRSDVGDFITAMKRTLDGIESAKKTVTEKRVGVLPASTAPAVDVGAIRTEAYERGFAVGVTTARAGLETIRGELADANDRARVQIERILASFAPAPGSSPSVTAQGFARRFVPSATNTSAATIDGGVTKTLKHANGEPVQAGDLRAGERFEVNLSSGVIARGGAELRILRVLASRAPARFTRAQWATLSGMKKSGGTWQTYVSRLRKAGYIDERDGLFGITPAGAKAAGDVARPNAGSVIADWKTALGSGPAKMIDQLVAAHPQGMDRANLADRVGMTAAGGTFQTYLSRLKSNGLVEIDKRRVRASETLFIDGRR